MVDLLFVLLEDYIVVMIHKNQMYMVEDELL